MALNLSCIINWPFEFKSNWEIKLLLICLINETFKLMSDKPWLQYNWPFFTNRRQEVNPCTLITYDSRPPIAPHFGNSAFLLFLQDFLRKKNNEPISFANATIIHCISRRSKQVNFRPERSDKQSKISEAL